MEVTFINPGVDYMIQSIRPKEKLNSGPNLYTISIRSLTGHSLQVCQLQKEETTLNVP